LSFDSSLEPAGWHDRFAAQARWTADLRRYLFARIEPGNGLLLDVGCGTGALLAELAHISGRQVIGLDLDPAFLGFARQSNPSAILANADAIRLPFPDGVFDLVCCHFLLLWTPDPAAVLDEMRRVTRPGGWLLALAEPDYGGRIDHPAPLAEIGRLQTRTLQGRRADPLIGRKLSGLFHQAGLTEIETGLLGGQWRSAPAPQELAGEWQMIRLDLAESVDRPQLDRLEHIDRLAWLAGERLLYIPTFYAVGRIPS
jgi:SAM-dependent methyltransferase